VVGLATCAALAGTLHLRVDVVDDRRRCPTPFFVRARDFDDARPHVLAGYQQENTRKTITVKCPASANTEARPRWMRFVMPTGL
jgi:hypothetical protein